MYAKFPHETIKPYLENIGKCVFAAAMLKASRNTL